MERFLETHGLGLVTGFVTNLRAQNEKEAFATLLKSRSKHHILQQFVTVFLWTLNPEKPADFQTGMFTEFVTFVVLIISVAFSDALFPQYNDQDEKGNHHLPSSLIWSAVAVARWKKDPNTLHVLATKRASPNWLSALWFKDIPAVQLHHGEQLAFSECMEILKQKSANWQGAITTFVNNKTMVTKEQSKLREYLLQDVSGFKLISPVVETTSKGEKESKGKKRKAKTSSGPAKKRKK